MRKKWFHPKTNFTCDRHLVPAQRDLESQQGEALPLTETTQRADQDISVENKTEEESKSLLDQLEDKLEGNTEKSEVAIARKGSS